MFSIVINKNLISSIELINIENLKPHEHVVLDRKMALISYLKSISPEILISSLIVCNKTNTIIDGHHRFFALKELGFNTVPVTLVDYNSDLIKPHIDERITKNDILQASNLKKYLEPKSSKHLILEEKTGVWKPIILISSLFSLKL
jgi:hypothetical protein